MNEMQYIFRFLQTCEEEEAKDELIGGVNEENWEPEAKAFELWSSTENVEEMQGTGNIIQSAFLSQRSLWYNNCCKCESPRGFMQYAVFVF